MKRKAFLASGFGLFAALLMSGCGGGGQHSSGTGANGADPTIRVAFYLSGAAYSGGLTEITFAPNGDMYAVRPAAANSRTDIVRSSGYGQGVPLALESHPVPETVSYFLSFSSGPNQLYIVGTDGTARLMSPDGTVIKAFSVDASQLGLYPNAVAADSRGYLYIASYDRVLKYDPAGTLTATLTLPPNTGPAVLIAVDSRDRVYVPSNRDTIRIFAPNGSALPSVSLNGADRATYPYSSFALDTAGNFYTFDTIEGRLREWDSAGNKRYDRWNAYRDDYGGLSGFMNVLLAVDDQQRLYDNVHSYTPLAASP